MAHDPDLDGEGIRGSLDPEDSDYESVESFVEACIEDGVTSFTWEVLAVLAWNLSRSRRAIRAELEEYGLQFIERATPRKFRTVGDNPHNRWEGNPCGGGSGWEQITGFAGREG